MNFSIFYVIKVFLFSFYSDSVDNYAPEPPMELDLFVLWAWLQMVPYTLAYPFPLKKMLLNYDGASLATMNTFTFCCSIFRNLWLLQLMLATLTKAAKL